MRRSYESGSETFLRVRDGGISLALEVKGDLLGASYYSSSDLALVLLEEAPLSENTYVEHLINHVRPTLVLAPANVPEDLVRRLQRLNELDGLPCTIPIGYDIKTNFNAKITSRIY